MSNLSFCYLRRVTYADCTVGNHVYYGRHLELLEAARGDFFRHLGKPFLAWQEQDTLFPIVECHLRYRTPARYDDVLRIELWVARVKGVRLDFGYEVTNQSGGTVLQGETRHVCTNVAGKLKPVPEPLVNALGPHLRSSGGAASPSAKGRESRVEEAESAA